MVVIGDCNMLNEITDTLTSKEFSLNFGLLYSQLVWSLDEGNSWKTLFETLRSTYGLFRDSYLFNKIRTSASPAERLLHELENRLATMKHLRLFLRKSGLLNALAFISDPEPLKIIKQPGREEQLFTVDDGKSLILQCVGEGLPPPSYQWFFGNNELEDETNPTLKISDFSEEICGEYYCTVSHIIEEDKFSIESNHVIADLTPIAPTFLENGDLEERYPVIFGNEFLLQVLVDARPYPEFSWRKSNSILNTHNCNQLYFESIHPDDEDEYKCVISNSAGELHSKWCKIEVILGPEDCLQREIASHKIALLIANSTYEELIPLHTPSRDVALIAKKLYQLNFHVIALENLNSIEMKSAIKWFKGILPPHAYGFFYFAGHGFMSKRGYKQMMPTDAKKDCNPADSYAVDRLLKIIMKTEISLFFMALDMCSNVPKKFKENDNEYKEKTISYKKKKSISQVCLYSTSKNMKAYDSECVQNENSLFATCLADYLTQKYPAIHVASLTLSAFNERSKSLKQVPCLDISHCKPLCLAADVLLYAGDNDTLVEMSKWYRLKEKEELIFQRVNIKTHVSLSFHLGCFQNTLQFVFPVSLNDWIITAKINHEILNNYGWTVSDANEKVLTVYNLQKAPSSIYITFELRRRVQRNFKEYDEIVDYCDIDLDYLEIVNRKFGVKPVHSSGECSVSEICELNRANNVN